MRWQRGSWFVGGVYLTALLVVTGCSEVDTPSYEPYVVSDATDTAMRDDAMSDVSDTEADGEVEPDADSDSRFDERSLLPAPEPELTLRVGPEGGSAENDDGTLRIDVPPGALTDEVEIEVTIPLELPFGVVGLAYTFEPSGLEFDEPVEITMAYPAERFREAGAPPQFVDMSYLYADYYVPIPGVVYEEEAGTMTGRITHFSDVGQTFGDEAKQFLLETGLGVGEELGGGYFMAAAAIVLLIAEPEETIRFTGELLSGAACTFGSLWDFDSKIKTRCDGQCVNTVDNRDHCGMCGNRCAESERCVGTTCRPACVDPRGIWCPNPENNCFDPLSDERHCGRCDWECAPDQLCISGECPASCPVAENLYYCGGRFGRFCTDLDDAVACGSCGRSCRGVNAVPDCESGVCIVGECLPGYADCVGNSSRIVDCETIVDPALADMPGGGTDVRRLSEEHCLGCGNACAPDEQCTAEGCTEACTGGEIYCDDSGANVGCFDPLTSEEACGRCGVVCGPDETCSAGRCIACAGDVCGALCTDFDIDPLNCGDCGVACDLDAGNECIAGTCQCPASLATCDDTCADLQTDAEHCGSCGNRCDPTGGICIGGACDCVDSSAEACLACAGDSCFNACTDTDTNANHCGACGAFCEGTCADGVCTPICPADTTYCAREGEGEELAPRRDPRQCRDLTSDALNCGACGVACADGETCLGGSCVSVCELTPEPDDVYCRPPGLPSHVRGDETMCTDVDADGYNCGACGTACPAREGCFEGECGCPPTHIACDKRCVEPAGENCRGCNRGCADGELCEDGGCRSECFPLADCDGACIDLESDPDHCGGCGSRCRLRGALAACDDGSCVVAACDPGFADCDGTSFNGCEVRVDRDAGNCGGCGVTCEVGERCEAGSCVSLCPAGETFCDGRCADLMADRYNCSACGQECIVPEANATCLAGSCAIGACYRGRADCDGSLDNGCEVNVREDPINCGACGVECGDFEACIAGACTLICDAFDLDECGDTCVDFDEDVDNCGECGAACALDNATPACVAGFCEIDACEEDFDDCDGDPENGCETVLGTDIEHCGACGVRCDYANATGACSEGACELAACDEGFADCDGAPDNGCEANLVRDDATCGSCDRSCDPGFECSLSTCLEECDPGEARCEGECIDVTSDPANCGACAATCTLANVTSQQCTDERCVVSSCTPGFGDCDGADDTGCETSTATSVEHCGVCGNACSLPNATAGCDGGECAIDECDDGFADCDRDPSNGCEIDLRNDDRHCGACGDACETDFACSSRSCELSCGTRAECDDFCADTTSEPDNCGDCGIVCDLDNATARCEASSCRVASCDDGFADCDDDPASGCEVSTVSDDDNCGACGVSCGVVPNGTSSGCRDSDCVITSCDDGFGNCDGIGANGCETELGTDDACTACDDVCEEGTTCLGDACGTAGIVDLASDIFSQCVLMGDGTVRCRTLDELGPAPYAPDPDPTEHAFELAGFSDIVDIYAMDFSICGTTSAGVIVCADPGAMPGFFLRQENGTFVFSADRETPTSGLVELVRIPEGWMVLYEDGRLQHFDNAGTSTFITGITDPSYISRRQRNRSPGLPEIPIVTAGGGIAWFNTTTRAVHTTYHTGETITGVGFADRWHIVHDTGQIEVVPYGFNRTPITGVTDGIESSSGYLIRFSGTFPSLTIHPPWAGCAIRSTRDVACWGPDVYDFWNLDPPVGQSNSVALGIPISNASQIDVRVDFFSSSRYALGVCAIVDDLDESLLCYGLNPFDIGAGATNYIVGDPLEATFALE